MAACALLSALLLATSVTANTVQFDIARSPWARDAQIAKRQLHLQAESGLVSRAELIERANTVGVSLTNARSQGLYFANVSVGTPGQALALQIDTGSSDIWVPSSTATFCSTSKLGCQNGKCELDHSALCGKWWLEGVKNVVLFRVVREYS